MKEVHTHTQTLNMHTMVRDNEYEKMLQRHYFLYPLLQDKHTILLGLTNSLRFNVSATKLSCINFSKILRQSYIRQTYPHFYI